MTALLGFFLFFFFFVHEEEESVFGRMAGGAPIYPPIAYLLCNA